MKGKDKQVQQINGDKDREMTPYLLGGSANTCLRPPPRLLTSLGFLHYFPNSKYTLASRVLSNLYKVFSSLHFNSLSQILTTQRISSTQQVGQVFFTNTHVFFKSGYKENLSKSSLSLINKYEVLRCAKRQNLQESYSIFRWEYELSWMEIGRAHV